jgi:predicted RNA-binding Zn-ribbon protein involved in translation (DUF1610 family)
MQARTSQLGPWPNASPFARSRHPRLGGDGAGTDCVSSTIRLYKIISQSARGCCRIATFSRIMIFTPWFWDFWNCLPHAADPTLHLLSIAQDPTRRGVHHGLWRMLETREISHTIEPVRCPDCGHSMILVCTLPKFVSLPEVRKYRCVECGLNASAANSGLETNATFGFQPQRAFFKPY